MRTKNRETPLRACRGSAHLQACSWLEQGCSGSRQALDVGEATSSHLNDVADGLPALPALFPGGKSLMF